MEGLQELTNALSNGTIPDPLWPPLPRDWGVCNLANPLISGTGKAIRTSDFVGTFIQGRSEQKSMKNVGNSIRRRIQSGSPEIFQDTHVQDALCGHLCDCTAFLLIIYSSFNIPPIMLLTCSCFELGQLYLLPGNGHCRLPITRSLPWNTLERVNDFSSLITC